MTLQQKKALGIVIFTVLYSTLFFLFTALGVRDAGIWSSITGWLFVIAAVIWIAAVSTAYAFIANTHGMSIAITAGVSVMLIIVGFFSLETVIGAVLLAIFLLFAQRSIAQEINERNTFRVQPVFRFGTRLITVAMIISIIALSLPTIQRYISDGRLEVPEQYIAVAIKPFSPLIENYVPGYSGSTTIDDIIDAQIQEQRQNLPPGFEIPASQKIQVREELSKQLKMPLNGDETVSEVSAAYINRYLRRLTSNGGVLVPILATVIVLLAIRTVIPLIAIPAMGVIVAWVYISKKIGLVFIDTIQVAVERLHL